MSSVCCSEHTPTLGCNSKHGLLGKFKNADQVNFVVNVLSLVHRAITTRADCANLLEVAGGWSAQTVFMETSFNYAPNVTGVSARQTAGVLDVVRTRNNPA